MTGTADLRGRTCVVTGANSGIGREIARELARTGARVVLACRDAERGAQAQQAIVADTGNPAVDVMIVDLARQSSIRAFAAELARRHPEIHVLVNNAGIWSSARQLSPDGIELTWATNVLAYHLLTQLLLEPLRRAGRARVVNVASKLARDLDLDDVQFERRPYGGIAAYAQSKQADRMLTWAQARRLEGTGITANAMHPGGVNTPLFGKGGGLVALAASLWARLFALAPQQGADSAVWLAASPEAEALHGAFVVERGARRCRFRDEGQEERLFELCEAMTSPTPASGRRPRRCAPASVDRPYPLTPVPTFRERKPVQAAAADTKRPNAVTKRSG